MTETVLEITKHLITLSTGLIGISITFVKDMPTYKPKLKLLLWSWMLFILSIISGLLFWSDYSYNVEFMKNLPSMRFYVFLFLEFWLFVVATTLLVIFKWLSLKNKVTASA
jgi:hypothetical protein